MCGCVALCACERVCTKWITWYWAGTKSIQMCLWSGWVSSHRLVKDFYVELRWVHRNWTEIFPWLNFYLHPELKQHMASTSSAPTCAQSIRETIYYPANAWRLSNYQFFWCCDSGPWTLVCRGWESKVATISYKGMPLRESLRPGILSFLCLWQYLSVCTSIILALKKKLGWTSHRFTPYYLLHSLDWGVQSLRSRV